VEEGSFSNWSLRSGNLQGAGSHSNDAAVAVIACVATERNGLIKALSVSHRMPSLFRFKHAWASSEAHMTFFASMQQESIALFQWSDRPDRIQCLRK
jgi:hypothetical protein